MAYAIFILSTNQIQNMYTFYVLQKYADWFDVCFDKNVNYILSKAHTMS